MSFFSLTFLSKYLRKPAGLWGVLLARQMVKMNTAEYEAMDQHEAFADGMAVFEIGFGPGVGPAYFCRKYQLTYHGVDFSELMVRQARRRVKKAVPGAAARLEHGDFLEWTAPAATYDRVLFANVSYFWPALSAPFQKIWGMLRPGGRLVFYMSDKPLLQSMEITKTVHFHHHSKEETLDALREVGFTEIQTIELMPDKPGFLLVRARRPE